MLTVFIYLFMVSISYQMKMTQSISRTDPIMKLSQLVVHMGLWEENL